MTKYLTRKCDGVETCKLHLSTAEHEPAFCWRRMPSPKLAT